MSIIKSTRFFLLILCVTLVGCPRHVAFRECAYRIQTAECYKPNTVEDSDIIAASYTATDTLLNQALPKINPNSRLLITTVANIDNLDDSSSLGRLIGEHLSARVAQLGFKAIEIKFQHSITTIAETGEFILTRELREMPETQNADAVIAGTYAVGQSTVYITLKLLDYRTSQVLSSYAYTLPIGPNTHALLKEPRWWEYED